MTMDQRTSSIRTSGARAPHRSLLGTFLAASLLAGGAVQAAAAQDEPEPEAPVATTPAAAPLAIRAQRVIVRPGHEIENAVVLVRDGRIVAVGEGVDVPEGAETLEGAVVCAGFMDPWSVAGIEPGSARTSSSDASVMAAQVIDPYGSEDDLDELVAAGVVATRSQIATGAAVSGIDVVLSTAGANALLGDAALSTSLGVARGQLDPIDRVGQIDKLVSELASGAKYGEDVARYERDLAEWQKAIAEKEKELEEDFKKAKKARDKKVSDAEEKGKEFKEKSYKEDKRPRPPKLDAEKAMFARAVNGEIPIVVTANRALEIRELLRLTKPFTRMRMVIAGGAAALTAADDIAARAHPGHRGAEPHERRRSGHRASIPGWPSPPSSTSAASRCSSARAPGAAAPRATSRCSRRWRWGMASTVRPPSTRSPTAPRARSTSRTTSAPSPAASGPSSSCCPAILSPAPPACSPPSPAAASPTAPRTGAVRRPHPNQPC